MYCNNVLWWAKWDEEVLFSLLNPRIHCVHDNTYNSTIVTCV